MEGGGEWWEIGVRVDYFRGEISGMAKLMLFCFFFVDKIWI